MEQQKDINKRKKQRKLWRLKRQLKKASQEKKPSLELKVKDLEREIELPESSQPELVRGPSVGEVKPPPSEGVTQDKIVLSSEELTVIAGTILSTVEKALILFMKRKVALNPSKEAFEQYKFALGRVISKRMPASWQEKYDVPFLVLSLGGIIFEGIQSADLVDVKPEVEKVEMKPDEKRLEEKKEENLLDLPPIEIMMPAPASEAGKIIRADV